MPKPTGRGPSLPGNPNMMRHLQELQDRMAAEQEALAGETVEVSVGGGAVRVTMTGQQKLTRVTIQPELLSPDEHDMLSDLLVAAVNQAVEQSQALAAQRLGALTKGLGLPPGLGF
jgi:DNA-binding YbaB/EbfC family protein